MSNLPCVSPPNDITFTQVCTHSKGSICDVVQVTPTHDQSACQRFNAVVRIQRVKTSTPVFYIRSGTEMVFNVDNYYSLQFTAFPGGCPMASLPLTLKAKVTPPGFKIDKYTEEPNFVFLTGLFPVGTVFELHTDVNYLRYFECLTVKGVVGISNLADRIEEVNAYDKETKVLYVSSQGRPSVNTQPVPPPNPIFIQTPTQNTQIPEQYPTAAARYPWLASIIPHEQNQNSDPNFTVQPSMTIFPGVTAQNTLVPAPANLYPAAFDKQNSVPRSIYTFFNNNPVTQCPKDKNNTVFLKNLDDRGYSPNPQAPVWERNNFLKKQYQAAVTVDKIKLYKEKIETFLGAVYSDVVVYGQPLSSSFRRELNLFFLRIHVGEDEYPPFVLEYFTKFMDFLGAGNPVAPGRNLNIMFGSVYTERVKEYFAQRAVKIAAEKDETTLIYWWQIAGMPQESVIFEAIHNIVAFSQFNNTIYGMVVSAIPGINVVNIPPPPAAPVFTYTMPDFFKAYNNFIGEGGIPVVVPDADKPKWRAGVTREVYRLLVPNSASFSLAKTQQFPGVRTESRHIHQQIMIDNSPNTNPADPLSRLRNYYKFQPITVGPNVSVYKNYENINLDDDYIESLSVIENYLDAVFVSGGDRETVSDRVDPLIPVSDAQYQPVTQFPVYTPFGLRGYGNCAGQTISLYITAKILQLFNGVKWRYADIPNPDTYPKVPVAPFKMVYDNIFADGL